MCFPGQRGVCLICLLMYVCVPQSSLDPLPADTDGSHKSYPPLTSDNKSDVDSPMYSQLGEANTTEENRHFFIQQLMWRYGNGAVIKFEGFEHLLHNLGLEKVVIFDHKTRCHKPSNSSSQFVPFHQHHNHSDSATSTQPLPDHILCYETVVNDHVTHSHDHHVTNDGASKDLRSVIDSDSSIHQDNDGDHVHDEGAESKTASKLNNVTTSADIGTAGDETDTSLTEQAKGHVIQEAASECMPATVILRMFGDINPMFGDITEEMFLDLCPALIYQMDRGSCAGNRPGVGAPHSDHDTREHDDHNLLDSHTDHSEEHTLSGIPLKVWGYSTVAVLVISLVGLLGVAVIPIMQKVFYNHMLQFLVAMAVGALSGDALLHLLPHAMDTGHTSNHHEHSYDEGPHDLTPVYKGMCGLMGIYFFFLIERTLTIFTDLKRKNKKKYKKKSQNNMKVQLDESQIGEKLAHSDMECDEMMMIIHPNKALKGYADEAHSEHCAISFENTTAISHHHGNRVHDSDTRDDEDTSMLSHRSHGSRESHGSHGDHGHSHDGVPHSVSAIAWMVILGDGIHNLSDGLAIGAAFANSITGGFSTAIAVFCHELPHEIGDFAVLMRAGMSAKQAVIYNCLSSALCFIGMLIGVAIGNIQNASLWIFAVVGGIFLYIALVDMLPEMSAVDTKQGEHPLCHLLLQCSGMLLGAGIMLTIALYENDLKVLLN